MVGPKIGTVFYPCREIDEVKGGMLYIWDKYDHGNLSPQGWVTNLTQEPQIISPKFNRLIIFDASKLHAVSHVRSGRRRAIAVNLWDKKPQEFN
jgi:Rps23 Pro-64 3,4-dihydroxylase Tpa1-like proline 4-hydroxylase